MLLNGGFGCLSFNSFIPGNIVKISNETFKLILSLKKKGKKNVSEEGNLFREQMDLLQKFSLFSKIILIIIILSSLKQGETALFYYSTPFPNMIY